MFMAPLLVCSYLVKCRYIWETYTLKHIQDNNNNNNNIKILFWTQTSNEPRPVTKESDGLSLIEKYSASPPNEKVD